MGSKKTPKAPPVLAADLIDAGKLLAWHELKYPDRVSESSQLFMLAAAEAALRTHGARDRVALFVSLVAKYDPRSVTEADIDAASVRLKEFKSGIPSRFDNEARMAEELAKLLAIAPELKGSPILASTMEALS